MQVIFFLTAILCFFALLVYKARQATKMYNKRIGNIAKNTASFAGLIVYFLLKSSYRITNDRSNKR